MIKLLITLAAVAAVVAASSAAVELPDLEASDADDLLDDLVNDDVDVADNVDVDVTNNCASPSSNVTCPLGRYRYSFLHLTTCRTCPTDRPATAYGSHLVNCGDSACVACAPGYKFDSTYEMCLNTQQGSFMNSGYGRNYTLSTIEEDLEEAADLEVEGCPAGTACCLQGYYGVENRCVRCPKARPSSPRPASGAPGEDCQCPNNAASSCFACGKCEKFNDLTGICDKKIGCKA
jgi:hypothetical protein